jgi:thioredoxin reductase (NADPH)
VYTDVVIIGGGPAGMTAAIWCKRLGLMHLLLEKGAALGGQLEGIQNPVIDYPGLPAANGQEIRRQFAEHLMELDCEHRLQAKVTAVDVQAQVVTVQAAEESRVRHLRYRGLILATGARERRLGVPGEQEMIERGEVYSASRDGERFAGRRVAVVGGGDRAFEGALLLAEQGAEVTLVHRSDRFRAREEFREPVLRHPQIRVWTHTTVTEVLGRERVTGVRVRDVAGVEREWPVDAVFVRIGVVPNSELLHGQVELDEEGYVRVDRRGMTSRENVFAAGDVCTRPLYSSIAAAVGQGMVAAKHLSVVLAQEGEEL